MFGFSSFVATFWHYASQREVGSQLPTSDQSDTLSASVNIDDIIDEYDEPSRRSKNASILSFSNARQLSQSYFSLSARRDDDTTSFYSALQDGFSLDEYDLRNRYSQDFFWNSCSKERDTMLPSKDFIVSWHDIVYAIKPKPTTCYLLNEIQNKLLSSAPLLRPCSKSGAYNLNHADSNSQNGHEEVTILRQINGSFKSGELTAIMGPSGAGKTSLLNFLSRRREEGFTGSLCVDDADRRIRIIAIPQDDHLPEYLTVRENLMFASRLKSPNCHQDHEKNVSRVSTCLGLDECLDTRTKNISGGQQKRLAIAQELLSKPEILILDEPTSGLDSLTCYKTLTVLKDLIKASAKKIIDPIAIVLTIHQPQHEAFDLFDKVYVMATGGIAIYDGPPKRCIEFVEKYAGIKMPSQDYNPASFLIDIASGEYGQEPIEALARQVKYEFKKRQGKSVSPAGLQDLSKSLSLDNNSDFVNANKTSLAGEGLHQGFDRISIPNRKPTLYLDPKLAKGSTMNQGHCLLKTGILTKRCWISLVRDRNQLIARILFHIFLPLGFSYIMGQQPGQSNACPQFKSSYPLKGLIESDEYTSPQVQEELLLTLENVATLFISIYSCISANIAAMTLVFTIDMKSSLKEFYNGWYSMNSYIFARMLSNIPLNLILPTITIALVYYTTGQNTGNGDLSDIYRILITALAVIIGSSIGELMGMIFGSIYVGHITTALFASQGATLPFVLLSGFVARAKNMSKFVRALSMTSLYKHCLEVTFIARYGFNVCDCDPKQVNGKPVNMTGVSEELKSFIKYYVTSQDDEQMTANSSEPLGGYSNETDMFQLIAKQVSLYNTYGIDVKSCNEVRPYQLYDFGLTEKDLPASFMALMALFGTVLLILLITVKLVVEYRTSL